MKEKIQSMIESAIADAEVEFAGADCDFTVVVISNEFDGLMTVKRQQKVLGALQEMFASGELHALSVKAFTPAQWEERGSTL